MFFRALTMFRFPTSLDISTLDACLGECALKPVGPLELSSRGFVPPLGQRDEAMTRRCGHAIWIACGGEDKLLPPVVIEKALQERLEQIRTREGRMPGGRARKRLRDEIITELLPRSHVKPSRIDALLDLKHSVIAIDTGSRRAAENVVSEIRHALGSFPALPINAEVAPRAVLTGWLAGDPLPDGLALGEDCELQDAADTGSKVRCYRVDLHSDEIESHLGIGRQCARLALVLDDHVAFELDESLVVRKFKLLDAAVDALDATERDDIVAELDARFALMAGEFGRLFDVLEASFRLGKAG